jgi:ssDNA-binding Zn-finger/Zn-ribbon topoisomerase 1
MIETNISVKLSDIKCPQCGLIFWVEETYKNHREEDHSTIYCPNGHSLHYPSETEEERLRKLVLQKTKELRDVEGERDNYAKEVARLNKRARAGVCPHCQRHFENLERHMKTKHTS